MSFAKIVHQGSRTTNLTSCYRLLHSIHPTSIMVEPVILVHGGAGEINDESRVPHLLAGVKIAALTGYKKLQETGKVLDAVEAAVRILEDNENFNAGKGSVLNLAGEVEMDASIMLGQGLKAGAVTIVKDVKNPITLSRVIMERTEHILLGAEGARKYAEEQGLELVPPGSLVTDHRKKDLNDFKNAKRKPKNEMGTVGAVGCDYEGHVAAATSTGGREGKMVGRCSDTSVLGSGTYADDRLGAVSTTGHGESIMRYCLAYEILQQMKHGKTVQEATYVGVNGMTKFVGNTAGAISVSYTGDVGIAFSSRRMSWAYVQDDVLHYGIDKDQHIREKLP